MGYEISASQLTEIKKNGFIIFSAFISDEERQILSHSPGIRDSFQLCPLTKRILAKRDLGKLLFEIIEKRPIRLVMTKKLFAPEQISLKDISIEEIYMGIFFSFDDKSALFFNKDHIPNIESNGFVAIYGDVRARYVQKDQDVDRNYLLKKGYGSGDKLHTENYPLIFK